jgi:hypothetical protein
MHGNNTRNLSVELSLSQTSKNAMFFFLSYLVFFNKLGEQEGRTEFCPDTREGAIMYTM